MHLHIHSYYIEIDNRCCEGILGSRPGYWDSILGCKKPGLIGGLGIGSPLLMKDWGLSLGSSNITLILNSVHGSHMEEPFSSSESVQAAAVRTGQAASF